MISRAHPRGRKGFTRITSGFTLIELLVVIAIIAILAAILFPVFAQAREAARSTACLNNIKQLATAWQSYTQDYDETVPPIVSGGDTGVAYSANTIWTALLQPYVKNYHVLLCPDSSSDQWGLHFVGTTGSLSDRDYRVEPYGMTFGLNSYFNYKYYTTGDTPYFNTLADIQQPSRQALITDGVPGPDLATGGFNGAWVNPADGINVGYGISDRHRGSGQDQLHGSTPASAGDYSWVTGNSNVSFADGHVKSLPTRNLVNWRVVGPDPNAYCVNYNKASVIWDPWAPLPEETPLCNGHGVE